MKHPRPLRLSSCRRLTHVLAFSLSLLTSLLSPLPALASDFPAPPNTERGNPTPLTPQQALAALKLPPGFSATLFAHEPEVQNPIAMAWDHRGRMWVAENFTYAGSSQRFDLTLRDRVIILEDKDHDGRAETHKVFTDGVQMLTSVELGRGGVWLMCPPQLLFIPDANEDDVPDGPPQVVLDGFTVSQSNYHNFANGLRWGPDGWLYGRCGHSCPGQLGVPGTPDAARVPIKGGLWRFHPDRKVVEVLTHGTTNPWGHDWDKYGECFFINTVNGHLWHLIPGAHLVDSNPSLNPDVYDRIDTIADHWHFDKKGERSALRDATADVFGGGHAHIGMMIYQGDQWPAEYRDKLFTLNLHGRRANVDRLERHGCGYVGRHEPDVFRSDDPWFRGIEISTGPDGSGYILDWSDTGECHEYTGVHRTSGRIFKITYGTPQPPDLRDLQTLTPEGVERLLRNPNPWFERQCRARIAAGQRPDGLADKLVRLLISGRDTLLRLRALWALHETRGAHSSELMELLHDEDEHLRVWAIRFLMEGSHLDRIVGVPPVATYGWEVDRMERFISMARTDPSGLVRLTLASTLLRLPPKERPPLASALLMRKEDADDPQMPFMVWYGLIPVANDNPFDLAASIRDCAWPSTLRWAARHVASRIGDRETIGMDGFLSRVSPSQHESILLGIADGLRGRRKAPKPEAWDKFAASLAGKGHDDTLRDLSVLFGDGRALDTVKQIALDEKAELSARQAALSTLIESRPPELRIICESLLDVRFLNATAVRGLALFDDPEIGKKIAGQYRAFAPTDRLSVMGTLVSRPSFAAPMLDQMAAGKIARAELTAFHARQIRSFNDAALTQRLTEAWGELRESPGDKQKLITDLRQHLTAKSLAGADLSRGRAIYQNVCGVCHLMYGHGGAIGPDLTGSGRANLDYLLENIVDPSAVVSADYRLQVVTLKDGRILSGIIGSQSPKTLTLRLLTGEMTIEKSNIVKQEVVPASMMPEALVQTLAPEQLLDLIAYLMHPAQVPLPAAAAQ
jgi:putative membrane-bound dehydrogenase-like protein